MHLGACMAAGVGFAVQLCVAVCVCVCTSGWCVALACSACLAWERVCVHVAGGAAASQAEKCGQENKVQSLCKEFVSASVSPLLAVKLVSHIPAAGSDLQLGTGVESSHPHVLPQHLSHE